MAAIVSPGKPSEYRFRLLELIDRKLLILLGNKGFPRCPASGFFCTQVHGTLGLRYWNSKTVDECVSADDGGQVDVGRVQAGWWKRESVLRGPAGDPAVPCGVGFEKQDETAVYGGQACICGFAAWERTKNAFSIEVDHNFAGKSGVWPDHQSFAVDVIGMIVEKSCFHLFADHIDAALAIEPFEGVLE